MAGARSAVRMISGLSASALLASGLVLAAGAAPAAAAVPEPPAKPTAVPGVKSALVTVAAAGTGAVPSRIVVTSVEDGTRTCTVNAAAGSCVITGLTDGTSYTFTAVAFDASTPSAASAASDAVTPAASLGFVSTWKPNMDGDGDYTVRLPISSDAGNEYSFWVDWGDGGGTSLVTSATDPDRDHDYGRNGTFTVTISGTLVGWRFPDQLEAHKLTEVSQWGTMRLGNSGSYFANAYNGAITATDTLDLTGTTDMSKAFWDGPQMKGDLISWDVSEVENMSEMFYGSYGFADDQDLSVWDVSKVTDMSGMFKWSSYNKPLNWGAKTASVTNMSDMFKWAADFNQDISDWDTSSVTNFSSMFYGATKFDQDIGGLDIGALTNAADMFDGVTLSPQNYDGLLDGWSDQSTVNVTFDGGNSRYTDPEGKIARAKLDPGKGWTITDAGVTTPPSNQTLPVVSGTAASGQVLTSTMGTWTGVPTPTTTIGWQQCTTADCTDSSNISGATSDTFTLTDDQTGAFIRSKVRATNGAESSTRYSAVTAAVSGPPVNTAIPAISGDAAPGATLTADPGTWRGSPAPTFDYQWQTCTTADCVGGTVSDIADATGVTFTPGDAQLGMYLRAAVTASNGIDPAGLAYSNITAAIAGVAPVNTVLPTIAGIASSGQNLTASAGTWTGSPAPATAVQWQQCSASSCAVDTVTDIANATGLTFTPGDAQVGAYLRVKVTATNSTTSVDAFSAVTAAVDGIAPVNTVAPAITGTAAVGTQLSATAGTWTGSPAPATAFQWQLCAASNCTSPSNISGAQAATFTPTRLQMGGFLRVRVTGENSTDSVYAYSPVTAAVAGAPESTVAPAITGTPASGEVLTVTAGTWSASPAVSSTAVQWQECTAADCGAGTFADISGATSLTFTPGADQIGKYLRAGVTASNGIDPVGVAFSNITSVIAGIAPVNTVAPAVTGTATVGQTLTATSGTWTGQPAVTTAVQWQACATSQCAQGGVSDISGAVNSTLVLSADQAGQYVRVQVTGSNGVDPAGVAFSAVTSAVLTGDSAPVNTIAPAVTGTPAVSQMLTATPGTWTGQPEVTTAVQWQTCATSQCEQGDVSDIDGATELTLELNSDLVGQFIRAKVTGSNGIDPAGVAYSNATAVVTGIALDPEFDEPASAAGGFSVDITNYDNQFQWAFAVTDGQAPIAGASASITSSSGATATVTVTGLNPGQSGQLNVTTDRANWPQGNAFVTGTALAGTQLNPQLGQAEPTAGGFTVAISNYDPAFTWTATVTGSASASISASGASAAVIVTGMPAGSSETITVVTSRTNYASGSASATGTSAPATGGLQISITGLPEQFVLGAVVRPVVTITADRSAVRSATTRSGAGISGTATVYINGEAACMAAIAGGTGSCAATITSTGQQRFSAAFTGQAGGVTYSVSSVPTSAGKSALVAISKAKTKVLACSVAVTLKGQTAGKSQKFSIRMRVDGRWQTVARGTSSDSGHWKVRFQSQRPTMVVQAKRAKSTSAKMTIKALTGQRGDFNCM